MAKYRCKVCGWIFDEEKEGITFEELTERIGDPRERGVVLKDGMTLRALYEERVPYYEAYADVTVEENGKSPEQIVQELGSYLEERGF